MAWDLSGHLYGVQSVLKIKELDDELIANPPPGASQFERYLRPRADANSRVHILALGRWYADAGDFYAVPGAAQP